MHHSYHRLNTKLIHSAVSSSRKVFLRCTLISASLTLPSMIRQFVRYHTVNINGMIKAVHTNENPNAPRNQVIATTAHNFILLSNFIVLFLVDSQVKWHFRVPFTYQFDLHENKLVSKTPRFSYEWFCTRTRFKTRGKRQLQSEIAYLKIHILYLISQLVCSIAVQFYELCCTLTSPQNYYPIAFKPSKNEELEARAYGFHST